MKSGTNYLTILATDISGSAVNGLVSGWSAEGEVNGISVSSVSVSGAIGGDGYYIAAVDLPAGQGYVTITNSASGSYISPTWFDLDVTSHDVDEVYGKFTAVGVVNLPLSSPARYSVLNFNVKQDSDFIETVQVASNYLPLTGYTNMTVQMFPATKLLDSTVPALSGTYSATVLSATEGTVEVKIGDDVLNNVIPQGVPEVTIYGDLKYFDVNGNERRPIEIVLNVRRDFNSNN
jgi:hypothetical protein